MRTHYCGEVTESLIDQHIEVCGWVHRRRDHGGVIFVDLRDREGLLQVVFNPENADVFTLAEQIRNEYVLKIKGLVRQRPDGTINVDLKTGHVEVVAEQLEVLNQAKTVPFQIKVLLTYAEHHSSCTNKFSATYSRTRTHFSSLFSVANV